jgi:hypothetical protein
MGKDRYFRQLDPKSYRIQGSAGQLFVGLFAAIPEASALDRGLCRRPEGIYFPCAATTGTAIVVVLIGAVAAVRPGAARQRQLGGLAGQPALVLGSGRGRACARA